MIEVDGAEQDGPWGEGTVTLSPGPHTVRMWFRYLGKKCGVAEVGISATPGSATSVSYRAPCSCSRLGRHQLGAGEPDVALNRLNDALRILPGDGNLRFARAGALLALGSVEEARSELHSLVAERPTWEVITRSFVTKGLINLPPDTSVEAFLHATP